MQLAEDERLLLIDAGAFVRFDRNAFSIIKFTFRLFVPVFLESQRV